MNLPNIPDWEIEQQFRAFLDTNNLTPVESIPLILDGQIHRYRLNSDKRGEKSGSYCVHTDNIPAGWAEDWRVGEPIKWCYDISGLAKEQQNYLNDPKRRAEATARRKKREAEQREKHNKAADQARIMIETLPDEEGNHPYLQSKQIYPYGVKRNGDFLAVPLKNIDGNIRSLQWIDKAGKKRTFEGALLEGLFWSVGLDLLNSHPQHPILLGEGFATMAKVYELTGLPSVAAVSCGRLSHVAKILKAKFPKSEIIITADNDKSTELRTGKNPGLDHAYDALNAKLCHDVIFPEFDKPDDGSDWDDFTLIHGDDKTAQILQEKIKWACMSESQKREQLTRQSLITFTHDLDKDIKLPPLDIIGGIFPRGFVSMIFAPPGTGKTIFVQKFVSDLSKGGNIFDGLTDDEPVRTSLILAGEAGYELLIRRAAMMKWDVDKERVKIFDQYEATMHNVSVMLDSAEGWNNVVRLVDIFNPDIVFIDSLISFHEKDENKGVEMKPILIKLATLAKDKNIAIVPVHHSRKRLAKERSLSLNQDDVIGSSVFNRYIGLIVGIEPMKDNESILLVKPVKSWFRTFLPFTYTLKEGLYGGTVLQTDLAPEGVSNSKLKVWNYLLETFGVENWFSSSQIILSEIDSVNEWQLRRILTDFVKNGKLQRRGIKKYLEYSIPQKN